MINFDSVQTIHCVGIKGAGVSGLACILKKRGKEVCGSDSDEKFFTDAILKACGIPCERFSPDHIARQPFDLVIYSTAWKESSEVLAALARGIPAISYPQALGMLMSGAYGIAVAGSHGKTTATAMLVHVMIRAGLDPTAVVGSALCQYGTGAYSGSSEYVVIEADEYENKFQYYHPRAVLLTNVDYDHPDYFSTPMQYDEVFEAFLAKTLDRRGVVVACGDDAGVARICRPHRQGSIVYYGMGEGSVYRGADVEHIGPALRYSLACEEKQCGRFSLGLIGAHNVRNALGVIALCDTIGLVDAVRAATLLQDFKGTSRRFEYKGRRGKAVIYDDFAHHPREIASTLEAARAAFPGKHIWCVFGAHTFSRTEAFLSDFAKSFSAVDSVLVLDIYGSAREQKGAIQGGGLADAIHAVSGNAQYVGTQNAALHEIASHIDEIDVLITMGAGDVWHIAEELVGSAI
ncbi:UDP-N-acetylmuramate--L-alanine ligase [Candidatus Uhrbacteria bacterium]|nr:UDP-N-acetylmuramate--L-alanine ligase [Candidatus Uhrbacteria bacterium]